MLKLYGCPKTRSMRVAWALEEAGAEYDYEPVNLRKGPSSNAGTYKVAQKGAKLRVVGRAGNWVKVADPKTNVEGYVYKRFLKESSAP